MVISKEGIVFPDSIPGINTAGSGLSIHGNGWTPGISPMLLSKIRGFSMFQEIVQIIKPIQRQSL
jgi:hypothetical protein